MDVWDPLTLFVAQYFAAWLSALAVLCLSRRAMTVRTMFGWTTFYALLGGSFAPIGRELSVWPAAVSKAERILASSFALGGGLVPVPWVVKIIAVKLGVTHGAE